MMFVHGDPSKLSQKITDPQFPKIPQSPVPKTQAAAVFIKVLAAFDGETRPQTIPQMLKNYHLQTRGKSSLLLEPLIVECVISIYQVLVLSISQKSDGLSVRYKCKPI